MEFANILGLWALLSLIPFIILYLRKPKPRDRVIPSLMFLVKDQQESKQNSFLQRFLVNLLFFLQLLALLVLAAALARPLITLPYDVSLENTILIIDASASMQATEGATSRFENAIDEAKKRLSGQNSIILAENIPLIVLEEESSETALDILGMLGPKATPTNLGDAMLLAKDLLGDKPGRVVVISDFNSVDTNDLLVIKRTLSSDEVIVEFVDVSNNAENAGIKQLDIQKHSLKVYVKNFNPVKKSVNLKLEKDGKTITSSGNLEIMPNSVETFLFDDVPTSLSKIVLEPSDDLSVDNVVYLSAPLKQKINVLLITNKDETHLENALLASPDVSLNVVNPPVLTLNTKGQRIEPYAHDVIIVHSVNNAGKRDGILPGTFQDLSSYVQRGGNLIITAQPDLHEFNLADLTVLNMQGLVSEPKRVCIDAINELTKGFENENCFATVTSYIDGTLRKDVTLLASIDEVPAMAFRSHGRGFAFYYGIIDDGSDFKTLPAYPIFWNALINFMAQTEDIKTFNTKTGSTSTIAEQQITTPSTSLVTSKVLFDEVGYYEISGKKIAANLLDEKESDVTKPSMLKSDSEQIDILKEHAAKKKLSLSTLLLVLVLLLLLLELWYIKRRGDL